MSYAGRRAFERRIVDAALTLAAERGWADLRMFHIAEALDLPLSELRAHFRDLDAIANAYFDRALDAVVAEPPEGFHRLSARDRLLLVMLRWFEAVEPHRDQAREMIAHKLYPFHPHHWLPMVFDLSRLVHWMLDAARIESTGLRRSAQEIAVTALFLGALARWALDSRQDPERLRSWLLRRLAGLGPLFADRRSTRPSPAG